MGWGAAVRIELNDAERSELQARARRRKIARADAMRAEIVLLAGPRPPRTSWRPSNGFAGVPSPSKLNVDRNF